MEKDIRYVGLDVDSERVAVAVADLGSGEVRSLGMIPNTGESVQRLVKKLGPVGRLRFCYEAGPHGYGLYWQLTRLGAHCDVVAPTLRRPRRINFAPSIGWGSSCCAAA